MRKCSSCKDLLEDVNFAIDKTRQDGLAHRCKNCQRKMSRKHYIENKDQYRNRQMIRKLTNAEAINDIKENSGCVMCGENRGICLDFHHIDANNKSFNIGAHLNFSLESILEEIKKCVVVCSNCHRIIHSNGEYK